MPVPATLHVPSSDGAPLRRPSGAGRDLTASQLRTASSERRERHARQIDDISMSPRLFGYVFGFVSSLVSMISAVLFLVNRTTTEAVDEEAVRDYFSALNVTVPEAILELFAERIDESELGAASRAGLFRRDPAFRALTLLRCWDSERHVYRVHRVRGRHCSTVEGLWLHYCEFSHVEPALPLTPVQMERESAISSCHFRFYSIFQHVFNQCRCLASLHLSRDLS